MQRPGMQECKVRTTFSWGRELMVYKEECNDRTSLKSQLGADLWLHPSMEHVKVGPHFRGAVKPKGDRSNLTENESRS